MAFWTPIGPVNPKDSDAAKTYIDAMQQAYTYYKKSEEDEEKKPAKASEILADEGAREKLQTSQRLPGYNARNKAQKWNYDTTKPYGAETFYTVAKNKYQQNAPPVHNPYLSEHSKRRVEAHQRQIFARERGYPEHRTSKHPRSTAKMDERDFVRWHQA